MSTQDIIRELKRQNDEIEALKKDIKDLKRSLNNKIEESEDRIVEKQQKSNQLQLAKTQTDVMAIVNKDLMPKIDRALNYIKYQMQDGDELVTEYRKRLHDTYNPGGQKQITSGPQSKADFQKNTFMFNDDD